jgi:uncharacterized protein (DUF983 family)
MATATTATLTLTKRAARPAKRGFPGLRCPHCGQENTVRVYLEDVTVFQCNACDAEWGADELRELIALWTRVLAWVDQVDQAPATEG